MATFRNNRAFFYPNAQRTNGKVLQSGINVRYDRAAAIRFNGYALHLDILHAKKLFFVANSSRAVIRSKDEKKLSLSVIPTIVRLPTMLHYNPSFVFSFGAHSNGITYLLNWARLRPRNGGVHWTNLWAVQLFSDMNVCHFDMNVVFFSTFSVPQSSSYHLLT